MKIAHVVSTYPPYHGGMGNVAAAMHQELLKRGHDSVVITPDYGAMGNESNVIRLKPWFAFRNSAFIPQISRYLQDRDVIHLHYPFYGGAEVVAYFKKKHPKVKLLITYHMDTVGSGGIGLFFRLYQKLIQPKILRIGDGVTASSRDYANHSQLSRVHGLRVHEIPFGVSSDFQPDMGDKQNANQFRLLFVGGLDKAHYFKGLSVLIEALSLSKKDVKLTVIGSGDLLAQYQAQAKDKVVADRITWRGAVQRSELIAAYQHSHATVLPSIDRSEAFGLVLLESMACQTPVIASDLPGVRTLARDGETGLLVKAGDTQDLASAIDRLAGMPEKTAQLGVQAHALVESYYRWPKIIDQLEELYKQL